MAETKESLLHKMFGWKDPKGLYESDNAYMNQAANTLGTGRSMNEIADLEMYKQRVLEEEQKRQQYELMRAQMQNAMWHTAAGSYAAPKADPNRMPLRRMTADDLNTPAGQASLEELADLWRARWGNKWVKRGEVDDEFYTIAAIRLVEAGKVEVHQLADDTRVYRLYDL